jgi:hypothetical protein
VAVSALADEQFKIRHGNAPHLIFLAEKMLSRDERRPASRRINQPAK